MLLQAEEELKGNAGLTEEQFKQYTRHDPVGHAIELRIYAENPAKDFAPSPGLMQHVRFPSGEKIRVDTWIETGTEVSPSFDPLLSKLMVHDADRASAITTMNRALEDTSLFGPPTNVDFLSKVLNSPDFLSGFTTTNMLSTRFTYRPAAIEFIQPGAYTLIEDWPGRVNAPNGVPQSGPMDALSLRIANLLVGNSEGTEGFEITMLGPTIKFHSAAVIALCGADFAVTIDGKSVTTWATLTIQAGSELAIGGATSGARGYLAIKGGLPYVAKYLGSKSTTPALTWGGYQGRCMRTGDFIFLDEQANSQAESVTPLELPQSLRPSIDDSPEIYALPGPYFDSEFLADGNQWLKETKYTVSYQSSRNSVRLDGPPPKWGREDGGEGGSHPSNLPGYGCVTGGASFTGDAGLNFMVDCPTTTGFVITHYVPAVELRRLAQLKPGDSVRYRPITWEQALDLTKRETKYLNSIKEYIAASNTAAADVPTEPLDWSLPHVEAGDGILYRRQADDKLPALTVRQSGENAILCVLGDGNFSLDYRARLQQLCKALLEDLPHGFYKNNVPDNASILISFDPELVTQSSVIETIISLDSRLSSLEQAKIPSRIVHLPAIFDAKENHETVERYMTMQRPYASYLPDNVDFIRRSNGLATRDDVKRAFFDTPLLINTVGWFMGLPIYIQVDPRLRLTVPKYNPSRAYTAAGTLGIGGNTCSIYPNDSPGGYVVFGMTLPGCCWDLFGQKSGFSPEHPWLFEEFDQIIFHEVSRSEYDLAVKRFKAGMYKIRIEETEFDMAAYSQLVKNTADEVAEIRRVQKECTKVEIQKEAELYKKWMAEQAMAQEKEKPEATGPVAKRKLLPPIAT